MKFLEMFFNILPFIMVSCTLLVIFSLNNKDDKTKNILFIIGCIIPSIFIYSLMGIIVPYIFLSGMFENMEGIILMASIIIVVWAIISLYIYVRNIYVIKNNNISEIYIRDIDVEYSPAVLSYLMNNKIETKKDLSATLLNLCTKKILKIQESKNGKINIIDLKNEQEVEKLLPDEKYAYEMLVEGVTNYKINQWKNKIEDEYEKYNFSKKHNKPLGSYLIHLYAVIIIGILLYFCITGKSEITGITAEIISKVIVATFVGAWEMIIFFSLKSIFKVILNKNDKYEFKDSYTRKGAKEYSKWKSFERFIEEFSLIHEKEYENIIIWGKYLSYSIALGINKKCDNELYKKIEKEYSFNYDLFSRIFENNIELNN